MARTQIREDNIKDQTLTGTSFRTEMLFYDETKNYVTGDVVVWKGDKYQAQNNITGTTEGDLSNIPDSSSDWKKLTSVNFSAYPSTQQTFNNVPVTLSFDTTRVSNTNAVTLSSNEFTFNSSGIFLIHFEVTLDDTATNRTTSKGYLELDTGSGYNIVPNTEAWTYNRTSGTGGRSTGSLTIPMTLNTGDKLRVQVVCADAINIQTITSGCNFTVFTTDGSSGIKGDKGDVGPSGDLNWLGTWDSSTTYNTRDTVYYQGSSYTCLNNSVLNDPPPSSNWDIVAQKGADGSGAQVNISDEGTNIPNTPHGTLNFVGSNVQATDAGSGVADITISTKHKYMVPIWAEENAALSNNTYEWAFGNGANTSQNNGVAIYVPTGYSAAVVGMTLDLNAGSATVELEINGTLTGQTVSADVGTGNKSDGGSITSQTITNADRINFKTQSASGTSGPNVVTAWVEYTEN